jgi:MoxR-like ATPase
VSEGTTTAPGSWGPIPAETVNRLDAARRRLSSRYVGRERVIRLLQIAVLCREHVLLLGPPGTAKTDLVLRFADLVNADKFGYLLTRFTEPAEIFGPLDFEQFRKSVYRVNTKGMLPKAEIAFLDEVFQGSSAILNSLLTIINERTFHNGAEPEDTPLVSLIGAANELPDDPVLRAFADRFLLRAELAPVAQDSLHDLLRLGWERERRALTGDTADKEHAMVSLEALKGLSVLVADVDLEPATPAYKEVVQELLGAGAVLSDRRVVRGLKLVAAAAVLRGATAADPRDLWPLAHFWTDPTDAPLFTEAVQSRVEAAGGEAVEPVPSAKALVVDAGFQFDGIMQRIDAGTAPPPAVMEGALGRLNEFRRLLLEHHPRAETELAELDRQIDTLIEVLGSTS